MGRKYRSNRRMSDARIEQFTAQPSQKGYLPSMPMALWTSSEFLSAKSLPPMGMPAVRWCQQGITRRSSGEITTFDETARQRGWEVRFPPSARNLR